MRPLYHPSFIWNPNHLLKFTFLVLLAHWDSCSMSPLRSQALPPSCLQFQHSVPLMCSSVLYFHPSKQSVTVTPANGTLACLLVCLFWNICVFVVYIEEGQFFCCSLCFSSRVLPTLGLVYNTKYSMFAEILKINYIGNISHRPMIQIIHLENREIFYWRIGIWQKSLKLWIKFIKLPCCKIHNYIS